MCKQPSPIRTFVTTSMLFLLFTPGITSAANKFGTLAVGVPYEDIDVIWNAGVVNIINGSIQGLTSDNNQMWSQDTDGIAGTPEVNDTFGSPLAAGDFNNDGFTDLAVGVPGEDIVAINNAGAVNIIYGSAAGLTSGNNKLWRQGTDGIAGTPEADDRFGSSLTAGDFNNDGFTDLAVGVPGEAIGAINGAGAVNIIYGSVAGLTSDNNKLWNQGTNGIAGAAEAGDSFGSSLTAGDFNNDGFTDLAVGVPGEAIGAINGAGAVNIIYGSVAGLTSDNNKLWNQGTNGIAGAAEAGDSFGSSLTAGDFNNDGFTDLAVGVPGEAIGAINGAGAVNIIYGSVAGLTSDNNKLWNQGTNGIAGAAEAGDSFGSSLTAGDFNNDGFTDLAVGVPGEAIVAINGAGAVNIIYGSVAGLTSDNNKLWNQGTNGIAGAAEAGDSFGSSLTAGDFNNDGFTDLAVGVPGEAIGAINNAGAVNIIYGSVAGLSSDNNQLWSQDTNGIAGAAEAGDRFGTSLVYLPRNSPFPWPMFLPAITSNAAESQP